jgi:hypothetical protein
VAEVLIEAGGSLEFGVGEEFEKKAWVPLTIGWKDGRWEQIRSALNMSAEALCGVAVPPDELDEHRRQVRKLAGLEV